MLRTPPTQPRTAQRQGELDTCGLHPPSIHLPLPSPMATRHITPRSSTRFLTHACLRPPHHSTITVWITRFRRRRCQLQQSTSIAPTLTPSRYANNLGTLSQTKPSRPLRGPKVFLTSDKTGTGVSEVFTNLGCRTVMQWEWVGPLSETAAPLILTLLTGRTKGFLPGCCYYCYAAKIHQ